MPISESRVDAEVVSRLPPNTWLRQYIDWARKQNQAHLLYHVGVGLAVYSQAIPIPTRIPKVPAIHAPIFVLLEGAPGSSHKTISIHAGMQVLRAGLPEFESQPPGSREVFADDMILQGKRLILMPEFGEFLASSTRGSYLNSLRTAFNSAFDGSPIARDTITKRAAKGKKEVAVPLYDQKQMDPRLSLLCGCAPAYLEENTESGDWNGGFMSRFWIAFAERERPDTRTPMDDGYAERLGGFLRSERDRLEASAKDSCRGFDEDAACALDTFRAELDGLLQSGKVPRSVHGTVSRCDLQAEKIALILACAFGRSQSANWYIGRTEMELGIVLARYSMESAFRTAEQLASTRDMKDRRAVLAAIGKTDTPTAHIIRVSHLLQKRVNEILQSLIAEDMIMTGAAQSWRLRVEGDPSNAPKGGVDPLADEAPAAPEKTLAEKALDALELVTAQGQEPGSAGGGDSGDSGSGSDGGPFVI